MRHAGWRAPGILGRTGTSRGKWQVRTGCSRVLTSASSCRGSRDPNASLNATLGLGVRVGVCGEKRTRAISQESGQNSVPLVGCDDFDLR